MTALDPDPIAESCARVLADALSEALPAEARTVLDVGCGDGAIARLIQERRPELLFIGVDTIAQPKRHIPVTVYDGKRLPFVDAAFDVVMFVDLLRRTDDPSVLLREAKRVARDSLVLKDHASDGALSRSLLRLIDRVGDLRRGGRRPSNRWTSAQWRAVFQSLGLTPRGDRRALGLHPLLNTRAFERALYFVSRLAV